MANCIFISSALEVWRPTEGFILFLLIIGAFLFSGVALSIFTFYEDCYWGDEDYRKYLRDGKKKSIKA